MRMRRNSFRCESDWRADDRKSPNSPESFGRACIAEPAVARVRRVVFVFRDWQSVRATSLLTPRHHPVGRIPRRSPKFHAGSECRQARAHNLRKPLQAPKDQTVHNARANSKSKRAQTNWSVRESTDYRFL